MPYQGRLPYTYKSPYNYTLDQGTQTVPSLAFLGDTNNGLFSPATDNIAITTNGVEKLRVTSDGSVGIGTDNPYTAYKLHVTGTVGIGSGGFSQQLALGNNSIQSLLLGTGYTNLTLNALGGNVGIGTTNATEKLHVYSSGTVSSINIDSSNSGTSVYYSLNGLKKYTSEYVSASDFYSIGRSSVAYDLVLKSGNVGIGTTNPGTKLHVYQGSGDGVIRLTTAFGSGTEYDLTVGGNGNYSPGVFAIRYSTNGTTPFIIEPTGHITPGADATQNLGSPTKRWNNVYTTDLQLSNEGSQNDVDGTWGQYTIQEGENDLFLLNRRNGKKYKFVLQEVN
jgi:hypothetical protein